MRVTQARVHVVGEHISTDAILPGRYLNTIDPDELALHCFSGLEGDLASVLSAGDVVVAGRNFGCGSSREKAATALKARGVSCVVATSFARIFYRNCFNIGLPLIEWPDGPVGLVSGRRIDIDLASGVIDTGDRQFAATPVPEVLLTMLERGGIWPTLDATTEG